MVKTDVLIVEDNQDTVELLRQILTQYPVTINAVSKASECLETVQTTQPAVILLDYRLPDGDGVSLLKEILKEWAQAQVIMMSAYSSIPMAVEAVRVGALDVLSKPFDLAQLEMTLQRALRVAALVTRSQQDRTLLERRFLFPNIIGQSQAILEAVNLAGEVAQTDATVLVTGESGTGKEVFAKAIHFNSHRNRKPFFPINCSAIPDTLLESELFGYRHGAFTGASEDKQGILDRANGGTVFLDEIAETSPAFQAKLLRVLQDREYLPLGATELRRCDVRVVAATNKPLEQWVHEGKFREDLYFRINGFEIHIPPLRERLEDIVPLADYFLKEVAQRYGKSVHKLGPRAVQALRQYHWPGNVRELKNKLEMACILAKKETIQPGNLFPNQSRRQGGNGQNGAPWSLPPEGVQWSRLEASLLSQAMTRAQKNVSRAAKLLGLSRATLRYRLKKYNLLDEE